MTEPSQPIGNEASTDSEWFARCLEGVCQEGIVAAPSIAPTYGTRTRKGKTDRLPADSLYFT